MKIASMAAVLVPLEFEMTFPLPVLAIVFAPRLVAPFAAMIPALESWSEIVVPRPESPISPAESLVKPGYHFRFVGLEPGFPFPVDDSVNPILNGN